MATRLLTRITLLGLVTASVSGCIYRHTVEPLTLNFLDTPSAIREASGDTKKVTYYVDVQWDKNGIGAIAQKNGFEEVYYADLETLSVLNYWTQQWVHIYGK